MKLLSLSGKNNKNNKFITTIKPSKYFLFLVSSLYLFTIVLLFKFNFSTIIILLAITVILNYLYIVQRHILLRHKLSIRAILYDKKNWQIRLFAYNHEIDVDFYRPPFISNLFIIIYFRLLDHSGKKIPLIIFYDSMNEYSYNSLLRFLHFNI